MSLWGVLFYMMEGESVVSHSDLFLIEKNNFRTRYTIILPGGINNMIQNINCQIRKFRNVGYLITLNSLFSGEIGLDIFLVRCYGGLI